MLYTQQSAKWQKKEGWMSLQSHLRRIWTCKTLNRLAKGTYLTIWLLSESICNREISLRVVDGTPSSSICNKNREKIHVFRTPFSPARVLIHGQLFNRLFIFSPQTHLQSCLFQGHQLARCLIAGFIHLSIGSLSNFLEFLVVFLQ